MEMHKILYHLFPQTTGNFCMRHSADQSSVPKSHCLFKSNPHLPEFHHYTYPEATAGNALPFSTTSSKKFFITEQSLITTVLRRMKKKPSHLNNICPSSGALWAFKTCFVVCIRIFGLVTHIFFLWILLNYRYCMT